MSINPRALWDNCLQLIKDNVSEQQFNTWFRPIVFKSYKPATRTILVGIPSMFVYEYLEEIVLGVAGFVVAVECSVLNVVEGDGGAGLAQGVGGFGERTGVGLATAIVVYCSFCHGGAAECCW